MRTRRPRHPALSDVVEVLWVGRAAAPVAPRERIIPTGRLHLAWRACGTPLRLGAAGDQVEHAGVIGGPRRAAHVHDTPGATRSVGVVLRPGAVPRLLGERAGALYAQHVGLDALWGADARHLQAALGDADDDAALTLVEAALVRRLRPAPARPGLPLALGLLARGVPVAAAAHHIGCAPRTLRAWFDEAIGLPPITWARLGRLRRALDLAHRTPRMPWSEVALTAGYFDQAHLCRELRDVADLSPTQWRAAVGRAPQHVPLRADSSKPRRA